MLLLLLLLLLNVFDDAPVCRHVKDESWAIAVFVKECGYFRRPAYGKDYPVYTANLTIRVCADFYE